MSTLLVNNALVFDGHGPELTGEHSIFIEDGRIREIADSDHGLTADRVVDLGGRVVTPGFIDAHFHAYATHGNIHLLERLPKTYVTQLARPLLENALRRGFTTVRDAGGADYGLWRASEEGVFGSPRIRFSGMALSQTGGHGDGRAPYEDPCPCGWDANLSKVVDGVDAMRLAVREELRRGAHQIKLFVSGGVASPSDPIWMMQFAEEEIRAAVDEATRRRTYVLGHAYGADTIARSVRCGVRSIEHGNLLDTEAADVMAEHGAFLVPTLVTYDALNHLSEAEGLTPTLRAKLTQVIEHGGRAVEIARAAGVKIGLGTDLLGDMQDQQLHEFRLRGEVDTPLDVLRSATSVNAELLQMDGEIGCVAPGAHADLLAFDGNPLEDLSAIYGETGGPAVVIKGGEVIIGC